MMYLHVNDFTLHMDQLKELAREKREETLTDLYLDSILDPKFKVMIAKSTSVSMNALRRSEITIISS
jgi:hypothetical protein